MPLVLADSALEQIPAGFEGNYFEDSSDNSNALRVAKSGSLGGDLLRFPAGKLQKTWLWLYHGNGCPANSSSDSKGNSPVSP